MAVISDDDMIIMHDLITRINYTHNKIDEDIRDLKNLIHVIQGNGIRQEEFLKRYR